MKSIAIDRTVALFIAVLLAFFGVTSFASANHSGEEGETESHATSVHHDEALHHDDAAVTTHITVSATSDQTAKIQQLIAAMQQLVALLQHQLEHMESEEAAQDEDNHDHHE
jgi:hypothetical protein